MSEEKHKNQKKDIVANIKKKATEFVDDSKEALDFIQEKIDESLSEENLENVKQKTEELSNLAKEKTAKFATEAKNSFEEVKGKASEFASETAEHIADIAEDAKHDLEEVKEKSKNFIQRLFGK